MPMHGFDPKFKTPEEYILGCTYEIWEQRGIGLIADTYYAPDSVVRTPGGVSTTAAEVVAGTTQTLNEFPERQLLGEEIIIGEKASGFYSSHRVRSTGMHLGHGRFGPPTGRHMTMLTIADCLCVKNRIVEEWLVRDQAGVALQMGLDPAAIGARLALANLQAIAPGPAVLLERWRDDKGATFEGDTDLGASICEAWEGVWELKQLNRIASAYDRAVRFEGPSNTLLYGTHSLERFLFGVLGAIPDGDFKAHHVIALTAPDRPPRVAVRWSYAGKHAGVGRWGNPSGADLVLLGISHVELRGGKIVNEWMLIDEISVHAQIAAKRG